MDLYRCNLFFVSFFFVKKLNLKCVLYSEARLQNDH